MEFRGAIFVNVKSWHRGFFWTIYSWWDLSMNDTKVEQLLYISGLAQMVS